MDYSHLQVHNWEQTRKFKKHYSVFQDSCRLFNRGQLSWRKTRLFDWRMQTIEDDLNTLENMMQGGAARNVQDKAVTQPAQQAQELRQNPLWHEMQVTATEVHQIKEKFLPVMRDVEARLAKLEKPAESSTTEEQLGKLKERFRPVMQDIERRLIALESRPTESALSNVSFADDQIPTPMTTLIERIQVLELSFGTSTSSTPSTSLELRLNKMEVNQDNLLAENKRLQARINVLEESRNPTTIRQITDRLDSVIRMVNNHESDSYQVGQSMNDIQREVIALRQAVDAWNEEETQPIQGSNLRRTTRRPISRRAHSSSYKRRP